MIENFFRGKIGDGATRTTAHTRARGTSAHREGKKQVSAFVTIEKWRSLRNIATKTERTQTDLLTEAIDDLARKYAEPVAPKGGGRKRGHEPSC